jgi:hypothetical protein
MSKRNGYTVSGPAVEQTKPGYGPALSFALTLASHAARQRIETTFYVRDPEGEVCGRSESYADGSASVFDRRFYSEAVAA